MKLKLGPSPAPAGKLLPDAAEELSQRLPYFTMLLDLIERGDSRMEAAFGRHVHWGYWPEPKSARGEAADYAAAAERMTAEVYGAAGIADGQSVLDVGCGFGGTIASFDERFRRMQLIGVNNDRRQIERARAEARPRDDNRIEFIHGSASSLPVSDRSFDAVLAVEAIFHFPDRTQFFREAHRALKPGGKLALSDFVPAALLAPAAWLNVTARYYGDCDMRYSLRRYRRLAEEIGFRTIAERDITAHTLPTFAFMQSLQPVLGSYEKQALRETKLLKRLSRLRLLRYMILTFEKI